MKVSRSMFEYLTSKKPNCKLRLIAKDSYLEFRKPKYILKSIFEVIKDIVLLPIGFVWCILEFMSEIPDWFKTLLADLKSCSPIVYIKVVDDNEINKVKTHPKGQYHFDNINE